MKVRRPRPDVYEITATAHELSALIAGARMALQMMEADSESATGEAKQTLARTLAAFDEQLEHLLPALP